MSWFILKHGSNVSRVCFDGICKLAGVFLRKKRVFVLIGHTYRPRCLRFPHLNPIDCHLLINDFRPFLFFKHLFLIGSDPELGHAPHYIPLANVLLMRWLPLDLAHQSLCQGETDEIKRNFLDFLGSNLLFYGL